MRRKATPSRTLLLLVVTMTMFSFGLSLAAEKARRRFPPLPWTFREARVLYQPALVPLSAAEAVTPTTDVQILSAFGWTLGGVFAVEWNESPVGYYREVAVLSALVFRDWSIGAWASHIVVTEHDAAEAAKELFGLPAVVGTVDLSFGKKADDAMTGDAGVWAQAFREALEGPRKLAEDIGVAFKYASGTAVRGVSEPAERLRPPRAATEGSLPRSSFVFRGSDLVVVEGWDGWTKKASGSSSSSSISGDGDSGGGFALNLPSFSGKLPKNNEKGGAQSSFTELLRYDLTLGPARRFRLRPPMATDVLFGENEKNDKGVRDVLGGPVGLIPCLQVDGVRVVAGEPETA